MWIIPLPTNVGCWGYHNLDQFLPFRGEDLILLFDIVNFTLYICFYQQHFAL